jgi:hypothetical protein
MLGRQALYNLRGEEERREEGRGEESLEDIVT